ncbi:MAG: hypothetical protein IKU91_02255, partial [Anaerotignum sp.]|nr:hypothetical protein [Anaerotignum sp.]
MIRLATIHDVDEAEMIYNEVLDYEAVHGTFTNWVKGKYPTRKTAEKALAAGTYYVGEDENALKVPVVFGNKEKVKIELEYKLVLPNCNHRFGYLDGNVNLGNWYPILAFYENGKFNIEPYYSTGDPFVSNVANYSVKFEFPANMEVATTGNIISSSKKEKKNILVEAKAVRDFALILSDKFKVANIK